MRKEVNSIAQGLHGSSRELAKTTAGIIEERKKRTYGWPEKLGMAESVNETIAGPNHQGGR